jgi:hypothetical protein
VMFADTQAMRCSIGLRRSMGGITLRHRPHKGFEDGRTGHVLETESTCPCSSSGSSRRTTFTLSTPPFWLIATANTMLPCVPRQRACSEYTGSGTSNALPTPTPSSTLIY